MDSHHGRLDLGEILACELQEKWIEYEENWNFLYQIKSKKKKNNWNLKKN